MVLLVQYIIFLEKLTFYLHFDFIIVKFICLATDLKSGQILRGVYGKSFL